MGGYANLIIECAVLALIVLLASAASLPLRRRLQYEPGTRRGLGRLPLDLLAHASRPVMVLVLSEAVLLLGGSWAPLEAWRAANPAHVEGWLLFWAGTALITLAEGVVQGFFHVQGRDFPLPDLLADILRAVLVAALGLAVAKAELGLDIGPLLASTALLTAVIGFALQGVLGNLMAGMSLHLARSLRQGVWVDIDGIEGVITKTNWRETRLRTRGGHVYIIPNGKVADARIHNMTEPTPLRRHVLTVGASYADAPDAVIAALIAAAKSVPEVRSQPAPDAMIVAYLDFGINYRLEFWTREYSRRVAIEGAVNRMIWYQFKRRGIEIPFPMSDQLLNDFMAVVYNQRRLPPAPEDTARTVDDLLGSDLCTKLLTGPDGAPLLGRDELAAAAGLVRRQLYTRGETLCVENTPGEEFWVVVRGRLQGEIRRGNEAAAVTFDLGPGAVVGEMGALTGVPRSATIHVGESAELLMFGPEAFAALLGLHPAIPERLADLAAERTARNHEAFEALARELAAGADVQLERDGILRRLRRMVGMR
ncbi:MAG TPA: mechanosensitive ion channel family protein [Candidatus Krumholzibacteria bacterium]|nr:mechanosensitive ion channel family protein [Candidatus Krumholzibacteria bacterium]